MTSWRGNFWSIPGSHNLLQSSGETHTKYSAPVSTSAVNSQPSETKGKLEVVSFWSLHGVLMTSLCLHRVIAGSSRECEARSDDLISHYVSATEGWTALCQLERHLIGEGNLQSRVVAGRRAGRGLQLRSHQVQSDGKGTVKINAKDTILAFREQAPNTEKNDFPVWWDSKKYKDDDEREGETILIS